MKKMIITTENENRQFAFVKGNRPTNAKTVKAKKNPLRSMGSCRLLRSLKVRMSTL